MDHNQCNVVNPNPASKKNSNNERKRERRIQDL